MSVIEFTPGWHIQSRRCDATVVCVCNERLATV